MLTVPEAAKRARLSPETIRRWIRAGKLASTKVGTQHLIDEQELDALVPRRRARVSEQAAPYETTAEPDLPESLRRRIVVREDVLGGKAIVRGTRLSVELVLGWLASGWSMEELLEAYPTLGPDGVRACLAYGSRLAGEQTHHPLPQR